MMPGRPEEHTHDYVRHGTMSLFAALNVTDGSVIASTHGRHHAIEFKKFLAKINTQVPDHLDIHVVADNYGTHKHPSIKTWLAKHPRFHMHFTPTLNQPGRAPVPRNHPRPAPTLRPPQRPSPGEGPAQLGQSLERQPHA